MSFEAKEGLREVTIKKVTWIGSDWVESWWEVVEYYPNFEDKVFFFWGGGGEGGANVIPKPNPY